MPLPAWIGNLWRSPIVRAQSFSAFASPGPLTISRPLSFSEGFYIGDLPDLINNQRHGLFLNPGDSVDLGSLFTQKQINDSIELKRAILSGAVVATVAGMVPTKEPVDITTVASGGTVKLEDGAGGPLATVKFDGTNDAVVTVQNAPTPGVALDSTLQSILSELGGGVAVATNVYGEQAAVAAAGTVIAVTFTVPVGKHFAVKHVSGSGDTVGLYVVRVNGTTVEKRRSSFAWFDVDVFFEASRGLYLNSGDVVDVQVTNQGTNPANFNARIDGSVE